jgi:hypothetical protein
MSAGLSRMTCAELERPPAREPPGDRRTGTGRKVRASGLLSGQATAWP